MPRCLRTLAAASTAVVVLAVALVCQQGPANPDSPAPNAAAGPRWWKGNLHTHSLWSDGDDFPEMVADWYKRRGYDFLSLTDHNVLAEGERWVEVKQKGALPVALGKYLARFGEAWVERRTHQGKPQV